MEILSDAKFKGNISIDGRAYINGTTRIDGSTALTGGASITGNAYINGDAQIEGSLMVGCTNISAWSDLNNILDFAPKSLSSTVSSLSTTVSSNITKINSACSTISSLCTTVASNTTKINSACSTISSLCTTVSCLANLPKYGKITLCFDVPADCTKFVMLGGPFYGSFGEIHPEYMFMTKGGKDRYDPMSVVNVDLESRCDSTGSTGGVRIFVTKSSGFCMYASDNYVLKYFYISDKSTNGC